MKQEYTINKSTGCWNWDGNVDKGTGYPRLSVRSDGSRTHLRAHRYLYEREVGNIPKGMVLDHLCRNRKCVNPKHLEVTTDIENIRRGKVCKINSATAIEIRTLRDSGKKMKEIGDMFGISESSVSRIISNKHWKLASQSSTLKSSEQHSEPLNSELEQRLAKIESILAYHNLHD